MYSLYKDNLYRMKTLNTKLKERIAGLLIRDWLTDTELARAMNISRPTLARYKRVIAADKLRAEEERKSKWLLW